MASIHDIPTLLALYSLDTRHFAVDVPPLRDCESQAQIRHSDISCVRVGSVVPDKSGARLLYRNRRLAARRSMVDHVGRLGVGGLLVVDLAKHHCARRHGANGKAYLETNSLNSVLGNRVRISNGRPP